jgi:hypothetical protein
MLPILEVSNRRHDGTFALWAFIPSSETACQWQIVGVFKRARLAWQAREALLKHAREALKEAIKGNHDAFDRAVSRDTYSRPRTGGPSNGHGQAGSFR